MPAIREMLQRGLIDFDTKVYFGNWALSDGVLEGTVQNILSRGEKMGSSNGRDQYHYKNMLKIHTRNII